MKKLIELKCPWLEIDGSDAEVLKWLVNEGDLVELDQDIMLLMVDEEEFILPSPTDGIIVEVLVESGDCINPDQVLAIIEEK